MGALSSQACGCDSGPLLSAPLDAKIYHGDIRHEGT